jgi:hypothetical protein
VLDEVKSLIRARAIRENILAFLESRFGSIPAEGVSALERVSDESSLKELVRLAASCADLDAFAKSLAGGP